MLDKELLAYIKEKKGYLFATVIINIFGLILNLGITSSLIYAIYAFINSLATKGFIALGLAVLLAISKAITIIISTKLTTKLADYVVLKLREDTYTKFLALNTNIAFSVNEMAQLSTEGIEQLRLYYSLYLPSFFYAMIAPLLLFVLFSFIDVVVALVYLVCIPLIPLSIVLVSKWAKRIFNKYWDIYLGLGDSFLDNVKGMKELKIFQYDKKRVKEMQESSEEFRKITMKVLVMQLYSVSIMDLVAYGGAGIGIVLALISLQNGLSWYLALFIILVGAEFFLPLRRLGSAFHIAMNGATAGKKVMKLLKAEEQIRPEEINGSLYSLSIKNLNFNYPDKPLILENINMEFNKGLYSIVGTSGSGKSTLAKIMANILNDYQGNVLFNAKWEAKEINLKGFYQKVAYVAASSYMMNKTIKEQFRFYNPNMTEKRMWELLELVKMTETIKRNGGLDFLVKEGATNISGGEKQRLLIAYYLAKDYDFYIFDEATSNIDSESESIILAILENLSKNKIVINITHRLKNVLTSNYIYFLENSKIKEEGKVEELLTRPSTFRHIYQYQTNLEVIKWKEVFIP